MADLNRVVAHFEDGTLIKGTTADFNVNKPSFHLIPIDGSPGVELHCRSLKAVFFVKDLKGGPHSSALRGFADSKGATTGGKKVAVLFHDGELLCGYTLGYVPGREGFFMFPADATSNNLRVFVINAHASEVRVGTEADELVARVMEERKRAAIRA
jgi:uncharacterized protein DUF6982